ERASDIHVEPEEKTLRIRYRIDGLLQTQMLPPEITRFQNAIISRIKIMSRLNIAEKRLPQDGRIKMRVQGREIDVRVSIIPMIHGEGLVLRLLDKGRMVCNLAHVGMLADVYSTFKQLLARPHGITLVTGPTRPGRRDLSTLHTRHAPAPFRRVIGMGIGPFLVASTGDGVMAQRLVRTVCPDCKPTSHPERKDVPNDSPRNEDGSLGTLYRGAGC